MPINEAVAVVSVPANFADDYEAGQKQAHRDMSHFSYAGCVDRYYSCRPERKETAPSQFWFWSGYMNELLRH